MTSWSHMARQPRPGRRLAVRIAAPVAVAAALAGAVLTVHTSPTASGHDRAANHGTSAATAGSPLHIDTAAYSLDRQTGDRVKVTVHSAPGTTPNAAQLRKDLASMGIKAQVSTVPPTCYPRIYNLAQRRKNGDFVAEVLPHLAGQYPETILFSLKNGDKGLTLTIGGNAKTCSSSAHH